MNAAEANRDAEPSAASLAGFTDLLMPCLDAVGARSVIEVGAYEGEFTRDLVAWAERSGGRVSAIDPEPRPELVELAERSARLELIGQPSISALRELPAADALFIDGDHNHFTVLSELRLIAERAGAARMPLVALHDVSWPHARRDTYYAPDRIPERHRQPLAHDVRLAPGIPGVARMGLHFEWAAEHEGGSRNGVLTAVEDFMAEARGLRLAVVPVFFGLGILWAEDAEWSEAIARIVDPWDRSPILERLEAARLAQIADRIRLNHQEALLRSLLNSRAFALAEGVSKLRQRGAPAFSRDRVREVLGEDPD
jgi:hypothetical protein